MWVIRGERLGFAESGSCRPDVLPITKPTVAKHSSGNCHVATKKQCLFL